MAMDTVQPRLRNQIERGPSAGPPPGKFLFGQPNPPLRQLQLRVGRQCRIDPRLH